MSTSSTFFDMSLSEGMKSTLLKIGFTAPTPIQEKTIPDLLAGCDLMGQAQTGTGKTGAFSIPLIELIDENASHLQALVVCPTRELCLQVSQEIKRLSAHKQRLEILAIYGGQSIEQQFRALKVDMPQIVVATPGRLFDHLRRKSISLSQVSMIVLDEADEMLDMGFRPEIEQIFELLPEENQRIFFSATMAKAIKDLACSYLRNPKIIKTDSKTLTVSTIKQSYFKVRGREKTELLCRMLDFKEPKLAVVFCNAKSTVDEVVDDIKSNGFEAGVLHGDLSQNQRDRVMAQFKSGLVKVLVATDVAARGLDIDDVELVCNYHLPHDPEDYVHRIGRTGRAGRTGFAISLVEPRDNSRLRRISQFAKIEIAEEQPPTLAQVKAAKLANLFGQVKEALESKKIHEYRSALLKQQLSPEDVAAAMLHMALKRFDDAGKTEAAFEDLKQKKYSGYEAEKRFKGRSDNEFPRGRGRGYSDRPRRNSPEEGVRKSFNSQERGPARFGAPQDRRDRPFGADRKGSDRGGARAQYAGSARPKSSEPRVFENNSRFGRKNFREDGPPKAGKGRFAKEPSPSRDRDPRPSFVREVSFSNDSRGAERKGRNSAKGKKFSR